MCLDRLSLQKKLLLAYNKTLSSSNRVRKFGHVSSHTWKPAWQRHFGTVLSLRTSGSPECITLFDLLDSGSVRLPSLPRFVRSPPRPTPSRVPTPRALPDLASASWTMRSYAFGMGWAHVVLSNAAKSAACGGRGASLKDRVIVWFLEDLSKYLRDFQGNYVITVLIFRMPRQTHGLRDVFSFPTQPGNTSPVTLCPGVSGIRLHEGVGERRRPRRPRVLWPVRPCHTWWTPSLKSPQNDDNFKEFALHVGDRCGPRYFFDMPKHFSGRFGYIAPWRGADKKLQRLLGDWGCDFEILIADINIPLGPTSNILYAFLTSRKWWIFWNGEVVPQLQNSSHFS